jgi:hypothetical protein
MPILLIGFGFKDELPRIFLGIVMSFGIRNRAHSWRDAERSGRRVVRRAGTGDEAALEDVVADTAVVFGGGGNSVV